MLPKPFVAGLIDRVLSAGGTMTFGCGRSRSCGAFLRRGLRGFHARARVWDDECSAWSLLGGRDGEVYRGVQSHTVSGLGRSSSEPLQTTGVRHVSALPTRGHGFKVNLYGASSAFPLEPETQREGEDASYGENRSQ